MKRNVLSMAVRGVIAATVGLTAFPHTGYAQDEGIEEIVVTGSRIKRSNIDDAGQLITMDRVDIDNLSVQSVADALRSSPLNTLGSFNERSGSSAQSNATMDLRGLGSSRTLVLVNSRRLTGSPNLGAASTNINMIPMVAIERGEILADGASTVYGSDAVAGVVNMQMRDSFEGIEFKITHGDRSRDDGVERGYSFIAGGSGERGRLVFAAEKTSRDAIFDKDREYTAASYSDTNGNGVIDAYVDTVGYSFYGSNVGLYDPTTGYDQILPSTACPGTGGDWLEADANLFWVGSTGADSMCMYGYALVSANKASLDRTATYVSGSYELTDTAEFFGSVLLSQVDSFGRYAPPAAPWSNMPETYAGNPFDIATLIANGDIDANTYGLTGYYRWTNIGPRDNLVEDMQLDFVGGVRGEIGGNMSYEVYAQQSRYDSKEFGYYYLSYPGLDLVLNEGTDPFSPEGAAAMRAVTTQDNFTDMSKYYGHLQFGAGDLFGAGDVEVLVGFEQFEVEYQNKYDSHSEAGLVGGSAGNSSAGERDVTAIFAETIMPLPGEVELNLSARWDDYSDFGSEVSPALSVRWDALENVTVRGRISKSFRAPALDDLYGPETFSAEDVVDYVNCASGGIPLSSCPNGQRDTYYSSNPNVKAETADALSIGVNWEFVEDWSVDLGYWNVDISDTITTPLPQAIVYAELGGSPLTASDGAYVDRSGARPIFYSSPINIGEVTVNGIDLQVHGLVTSGVGDFNFDFLASQQLSYEESIYPNGPVQDIAGFNLSPELRAQFVIGWSMDAHSVAFVTDYIGPHADQDIVNPPTGTSDVSLSASGTDLDSWITHTLSYSFDAEEYGMFKLSARNLTDEDPVFDRNGEFIRDHYDLYDNTGRVIVGEYTISF